MFTAKDIMTTHVVTVSVDDTVDYAITLMVKHRISGLPVLDKQGRPVGIVSEFDLLELICEGLTEQDKIVHYMSTGLCGVAAEDSWVTVADTFRAKHIRRLPVLRDGNLLGIITRHDLMHAIRDARRRMREQLAEEASLSPPQPCAETGPACAATSSGKPDNPQQVEAVEVVTRNAEEPPLYSSLGADPELAELVELFVQEMAARIGDIQGQAADRQWAQLARTVHQIKGAGGSYGFPEISVVAARLEAAVREGQEDRILREVDDLTSLCRRARSGAPPANQSAPTAPAQTL
jgi:CBS domain-containing protein/HPt (histidine-containing phosphotransfer) domain-containing protein